MRKLQFFTLLVGLTSAACGQGADGRTRAAPIASSRVVQTATTEFGRLIQNLSEPGGYFDTDNLISNETSYLHVMGRMREMEVSGGAYLGVGPSQNFSYMAQIRPSIAFLVDIRRDNLLQHFLFKALFQLADSRVHYLAMLFGRPIPRDTAGWAARGIEDLVAYIDGTPPDEESVAAYSSAVAVRVTSFGLPISDSDLATIRRFHNTFIRAGPGLRFNSFNRAPQPYYPTLRQLLLETDLTGKKANYLAAEEHFLYLKSMQQRDLIVPVVGDLAGDRAVRAIGDYLEQIDERVSAFYTSNVEFYLMGDGSFDRFADNVATLPRTERSVIIRSYFGGRFRYRHPEAVPGYYSVQLLQTIQSFVEEHNARGFASYLDVVTKHSLNLR
ncbi:MAG: hypothetical protein O7F08_10240 [Deltaproteobacteria bacterium]|nr:hypothetical protein [Deltaproteobacteria bacterium]